MTISLLVNEPSSKKMKGDAKFVSILEPAFWKNSSV